MSELHQKYAPILRFSKNERFFPMRADELLKYSSLYVKDQDRPLLTKGQVTPAQLTQKGQSNEVFLCTIEPGPLSTSEVVES